MERFKISPNPSKFAKRFISENQPEIVDFPVQPPRPKPKPEQQDEKPEMVIEHYLDENGRWIGDCWGLGSP